jgi:acyl carrier protein
VDLHRDSAYDGPEEVEASADGVWSFGEFWARVSDAIGIGHVGVDPKTSLRAELELDSLHMAELVVFMDELGCEVPEDLIPVLETAGDVYDHYVTRITAEAPRAAR